jgi:hypothetical protein
MLRLLPAAKRLTWSHVSDEYDRQNSVIKMIVQVLFLVVGLIMGRARNPDSDADGHHYGH